jgi:Camelysin metallo-endopeptidase
MRLLKKLLAHKVLASAAAVAVVSAGAIGGTFANFTATPITISSNAFATGTLTISRSGTGVLFNADKQKVGQESTGSVAITNTGTIDGVFTLAGSATGALAPKLQLVIYKDTDGQAGSKVYDGTLAAFSSADLGTFAGGASHTYYFHVSLPTTGTDAGDNALQGAAASASFTWSATQA